MGDANLSTARASFGPKCECDTNIAAHRRHDKKILIPWIREKKLWENCDARIRIVSHRRPIAPLVRPDSNENVVRMSKQRRPHSGWRGHISIHSSSISICIQIFRCRLSHSKWWPENLWAYVIWKHILVEYDERKNGVLSSERDVLMQSRKCAEKQTYRIPWKRMWSDAFCVGDARNRCSRIIE